MTEEEKTNEQTNNNNDKVQTTVFVDPINLKEYANEEPYYNVIEKARFEMSSTQKRASKRGIISIAIISLCCIGGMTMALISQKNPDQPWLKSMIWVFVGLAVLSLIIFSIINKRIDRPDYKNYINNSYSAMNAYIFDNPLYNEASYDPLDKIELNEISSDGIYSKIESVISRNVATGKYQNRSFKVAEAGIYKETKGRQKITNFVGKLLFFVNDLHFEGRYVVVSKSQIETDLPDSLNDLDILFESGNFALFGPKNSKYKDDLGTKFIPLLQKIDVKDHLLNLTVVIWAGRTICYLSYDNNVVMLPFQDPYDKSGCEQFKTDLLQLFGAMKELTKD